MAMEFSGIRLTFFLLASSLGLAATYPEIALLPVRELVLHMRAPDAAPHMARWILGAGAVTFGIAFVAWPWLRIAAARTIASVVLLPTATFWLLVLVSVLLPRTLVAVAVFYQPTSDAAWYHMAAAALARGEGLAVGGELTAYRPPGYPFLLSLTYRLFGPDYALAWFWGLSATAIIVGAIHFIALRLHGRDVARLATLLAALYPALVLMTGQAMSDLPFVAGLLALAAFALAGAPYRLRDGIFIGVALGLLTLTRGVAIGLFAVIALVWHLRQPDLRKSASSMTVMAIAFAACIAPWMLRNQSVFGNLTLGTNLGMNAYVGNHPGAPGGGVPAAWPEEPRRPEEPHRPEEPYPPKDPHGAKDPDAPGWNEVQDDRELMRLAIEFVVSNPLKAAAILPGKLKHLYLLEAGAVTALFQGPHPSPAWMKYSLYAVSQIGYLFLLIAFGVRVFDLFAPGQRPRGILWCSWLFIVYFTMLSLVLHGEDRYRLPILPWMLIEAAVILARAGDRCGKLRTAS